MSNISSAKEISDSEWLESAFFVRYDGASERRDMSLRRTNLNMAFHDTSLGGNVSINPLFQFNELCDPTAPKLSESSNGQGYFYNEAFDNNAMRVWFQAGIMEHNALTSFIRSAYNYKQAYLANTGQVHPLMYTIGETLGFLTSLPIQVYFGINYLYRRATSFLTQRPYSRFSYMTPRMGLYWTSATTLFNKLTANMNITVGMDADDILGYDANNATYNSAADKAGNLDAFTQALPDTFKLTSDRLFIDLMAVSSRGQRLANQYYSNLADIQESSSSPTEYASRVHDFMNSRMTFPKAKRFTDMNKYLDEYMKSYGKVTEKDQAATVDDVATIKANLTEVPEIAIRDKEPELGEFLAAELRDGSAFVSFVVENPGPSSETFTNTTKKPAIEDMFNSTAKGIRDMSINFAGGNIGDGMIADTIESALSGVGALLQGGLNSIGLGGLGSIAGSALTEVNEVYDDSEMSRDGGNLTIRLSSPYGDKVSILQNIYAPLCMLLALALPKATGKSTYGSPFVLRTFMPGRMDYKMSMIKEMTIARGTSNIGFVDTHLPTAVDVTLNIEDLNNVVTMPVATSLLDDAVSFSYFDEDSPLQDYLSALSGMGLYEQFYLTGRIATGAAQSEIAFAQMNTPAAMAQKLGYSSVGELVKVFSMGTAQLL